MDTMDVLQFSVWGYSAPSLKKKKKGPVLHTEYSATAVFYTSLKGTVANGLFSKGKRSWKNVKV